MPSRLWLAALSIMFAATIGSAGAGPPGGSFHAPDEAGPASSPSPGRSVDASQVMLPCIPVGTYRPLEPRSQNAPPGPELAVVAIDVRPKNARVHLDGEFIGRSRFFNGTNGFLYLEPGSYRLELRREDHRTVTVELEAEAGCRYDLKHFMERVPRGETERDSYGKGRPTARVFGPKPAYSPSAPRADASLRPDLRESHGRPAVARPRASLRLAISPPEAVLEIDGSFVATARELASMEGPLAVRAGTLQLEISAPQHLSWSEEIEIEPGESLELEVALEPRDAR